MEYAVEALRAKLAIRMYVRDHDQLPGSLSVLVPNYIETVPIDPFDGKPLRYSASDRWPHSVGQNYNDNGGSETDRYSSDLCERSSDSD